MTTSSSSPGVAFRCLWVLDHEACSHARISRGVRVQAPIELDRFCKAKQASIADTETCDPQAGAAFRVVSMRAHASILYE
jgi:hypothetical protein